jgi:hypothetical protein
MSRGGKSALRVSLASVGALLTLLAASASPAGAAVTLGQTFSPPLDFGGSGVFIQSGSPGNSYTVPSDGVITSWSFEAHPSEITPPLKLKVVRRVGGDDFLTVGDSQLESPMQGIVNTWPTRIAVKTGDVLAHFYTDTTFGYRVGVSSEYVTNEISGSPGDPSLDPPPGTTITYEPDNNEQQIDLAAVLEGDADLDVFGDETQDKCVGTPGTFNGCPSSVTIDSIKQKGDTKLKVTATVPGAGNLVVGPASKKAQASAKSLKTVTRNLTGTTRQTVKLTVKLTKSAIGKLEDKGKLKLKVKAVYTPSGGPPASDTEKKKLKS